MCFFPLKSGNCPTHFNGIPSLSACMSDGDCPENHKCCTFENGPVCVPPVISKTDVHSSILPVKSLDTPSHLMFFLYFHDYLHCRFSLKASKL